MSYTIHQLYTPYTIHYHRTPYTTGVPERLDFYRSRLCHNIIHYTRCHTLTLYTIHHWCGRMSETLQLMSLSQQFSFTRVIHYTVVVKSLHKETEGRKHVNVNVHIHLLGVLFTRCCFSSEQMCWCFAASNLRLSSSFECAGHDSNFSESYVGCVCQ
jgi:hypothetical protein